MDKQVKSIVDLMKILGTDLDVPDDEVTGACEEQVNESQEF